MAFESPKYRQGLLTRAVTDVFQAVDGPTSLIEVVDRVMERVRAEAGRMGIRQTPVLLGHVEGGLVLPRLVPACCISRRSRSCEARWSDRRSTNWQRSASPSRYSRRGPVSSAAA